MTTRLDFVYDEDTGAYIHGNGQIGGNGMSAQDPGNWIQNIAYDYQTYSGTRGPVVSGSAPTTYAPQASDSGSSFWNILNGISGAIDGVRQATNPGYNQPLNPNTPYYNQYGVPFNPGAPGTSPGPGSGFLDEPIFAGFTGTHALMIAALVAGILILRK